MTKTTSSIGLFVATLKEMALMIVFPKGSLSSSANTVLVSTKCGAWTLAATRQVAMRANAIIYFIL